MKYSTDVAVLNKEIKSIAVRGAKLDHDIHRAGVGCLAHLAEHNNCAVLNNLVNALPKGTRKGAFVEWALAYGKVRVLDKGNDADAVRIERGEVFALDKSKQFMLDDAIANAWYNFKPEKDVLESFDVQKAVQQLMRRVAKAQKDGATLEGVNDALASLQSFTHDLGLVGTTLSDEV